MEVDATHLITPNQKGIPSPRAEQRRNESDSTQGNEKFADETANTLHWEWKIKALKISLSSLDMKKMEDSRMK